MARMIAEVYQAFKAAGVGDQTAQAAATALAQRDDELHACPITSRRKG